MNTETKQKVQKVDKLLTDILVHFPSPRGGETDLWPSVEELCDLDIAVLNLAMTQREKPLRPFWKAFKLVNRRWPKLKLVKRVKDFVEHARDRVFGNRKQLAGAFGLSNRVRFLAQTCVDRSKSAPGRCVFRPSSQ